MSRPQPIVRQMLLTLVVAVGIGAAWSFATFWVVVTLEQTIVRQRQVENLYVRYDGEPVLMRYDGGGSVANRRLVTLDGEPARGNSQQVSYPQYLAAPRPSPSNGGNRRLAGASDGGAPATYWYLIHDGRATGHAYGVGYDVVSKQVTGYFGRSGFSDQQSPREDWFQIAGDQGLDLATPDVTTAEPYGREPFIRLLADGQLWVIDLRKKKVESLLPCPTAFTVGWSWRMIAELPPEEEDPSTAQRVIVLPQRKLVARSLDSLTIVDQRSGEQTVLPLPPSMQDQQCACFERADGSFILLTMEVRERHLFHRVVWLDKSGIVQRERTLELGSTQAFDNPAVGAILAAAAVPVPLLVELFPIVAAWERVSYSEFDSYSAALLATLADFWPAMLLVAVIGLALSIAAYRRQRHYALPYAGLWAVFVFLMGVPGYLAYRFHRTWPVLEDCPRCGEPSPRDRDRCSDCGAAFPPPELKGLEIFA